MIDYRLTSKQLDELRAAHREASDIRSACLGQGLCLAQVLRVCRRVALDQGELRDRYRLGRNQLLAAQKFEQVPERSSVTQARFYLSSAIA
jgi:hypothetical protein